MLFNLHSVTIIQHGITQIEKTTTDIIPKFYVHKITCKLLA